MSTIPYGPNDEYRIGTVGIQGSYNVYGEGIDKKKVDVEGIGLTSIIVPTYREKGSSLPLTMGNNI